MNDKLVVNNAIMENYFDRKQPIPPEGPIQLQTHGGLISLAQYLYPRNPARRSQ